MPHISNHHVMLSGAIIVVSVVGAAAFAISQIPEVRQFAGDCRRKIAVALHNLGDEINPNRAREPRFNRPEDAQGFMQSGGEIDADEESRRRQREELMYWNAIKMESLERKQRKENANKGPTFDDILHKPEEETSATKTGAEFQNEDGSTILRRRGEGSRAMDRGSMMENPFADENYPESDADAKMIGPAEDEMPDIDTDNELREYQKPAPEKRVLAAAYHYHMGQDFTVELGNSSVEPRPHEQLASSSSSRALEKVPGQPSLEQPIDEQLRAAAILTTAEAPWNATFAPSKKVGELQDPNHKVDDHWQQQKEQVAHQTQIGDAPGLESWVQRQQQEQMTHQAQIADTQASEAVQSPAEPLLIDVSDDGPQERRNETPVLCTNIHGSPEPEASPESTFASIHAWAGNNHGSFYSPLPGTPKALSSAASEPEDLSGEMTPTDSISLAGSGEDMGNDNASSVGGGRYYDVQSVDGGISTPGSWTEVGSVVSEDDASHR